MADEVLDQLIDRGREFHPAVRLYPLTGLGADGCAERDLHCRGSDEGFDPDRLESSHLGAHLCGVICQHEGTIQAAREWCGSGLAAR